MESKPYDKDQLLKMLHHHKDLQSLCMTTSAILLAMSLIASVLLSYKFNNTKSQDVTVLVLYFSSCLFASSLFMTAVNSFRIIEKVQFVLSQPDSAHSDKIPHSFLIMKITLLIGIVSVFVAIVSIGFHHSQAFGIFLSALTMISLFVSIFSMFVKNSSLAVGAIVCSIIATILSLFLLKIS